MKHHRIIAREGYPFIAIALILTVVSVFTGIALISIVLAAITVFIICFFRNPERHFQDEDRLVISPADGKVIKIEDVDVSGTLAGQYRKISIFMNVFNVHVNRAPYAGVVEKINYHEGQFFSANLDKAAAENERNEIMIRTPDGHGVWAVQIAGLIARRIVCWVREGDTVQKGERVGLIRFGSRVDVYLPLRARVTVKNGDKVKAGQTPLGYLS